MASDKVSQCLKFFYALPQCTYIKFSQKKLQREGAKMVSRGELLRASPLWGERAHSLKLFCMYDKRFEI